MRKCPQNNNKKKGFTLVELLVVIALIGILSTIVLVSLKDAPKSAKDSERITEIAQLQLALEMYYGACKQYPSSLALTASNGCDTGISFGTFVGSIMPTDPSGSATPYHYGTNAGNTKYILRATLQLDNKVLVGNLDSGDFGVVCTNASKYYCVSG